jgi:hypothetical protein
MVYRLDLVVNGHGMTGDVPARARYMLALRASNRTRQARRGRRDVGKPHVERRSALLSQTTTALLNASGTHLRRL